MLETIRHDRVLELRLNRPPVNALNPELVEALDTALRQAPGQGAGAVVLSGRPGMFSAGLDVPALLQLDRPAMRAFWDRFFGLMRTLAESPVPVIAAVTGHSPAGGAVLTLFCDYRIAAAGEFKIGLNEVQVGLPVPPVIQDALARLIGPRETERLTVRGLLVSPEEAMRVGLVDRVVAMEDVVETALAEARSLLALTPHAMLATRAAARAGLMALFKTHAATIQAMEAEWFRAETQTALQAMVARLSKKP